MRAAWVGAGIVWVSPASALACAVCGLGAEQTQSAYLSMTMLLSFLPLGALGALIFLAVRRIRAAERAEQPASSQGPLAEPASKGRTIDPAPQR